MLIVRTVVYIQGNLQVTYRRFTNEATVHTNNKA